MEHEAYNLLVKAGEYTDKEGEIKAIWRTVGKLFAGSGKRHPMILLDKIFNPAGVWVHPDHQEGGSVQLVCRPPDEVKSAKEKKAQIPWDAGDPPF